MQNSPTDTFSEHYKMAIPPPPAVWRFLNSDSVNTVVCTKVIKLAYLTDGNLQIRTVILQPTLRNYHFNLWKWHKNKYVLYSL